MLQLPQSIHQRNVHRAELRPPLVERRLTGPVLAARVWYRQAVLHLLQDCQDLAVGES